MYVFGGLSRQSHQIPKIVGAGIAENDTRVDLLECADIYMFSGHFMIRQNELTGVGEINNQRGHSKIIVSAFTERIFVFSILNVVTYYLAKKHSGDAWTGTYESASNETGTVSCCITRIDLSDLPID